MQKLSLVSTLLLAAILSLTADKVAFSQSHQCEELMVPMRDGVELATDVYRPSDSEGPFAVLVRRTPYGKNNCEEPHAIYFAERGFVVVSQDERGRYNSKGDYYWYKIFADDGYDTIEWAATQPWSNGKVGTFGTSFLCVNQYTTLPSSPPSLAAAFCTHGAANPYKYAVYQGGALQMIMPSWLLGFHELARPEPVPIQRGYSGTNEQWLQWYQSKQENDLAIGDAMLSGMMRDMIENSSYNDYWKQYAADEMIESIDVPVLHFASSYDRYALSQVHMFNLIREHGGSKARNSQKLVLGPWVHGFTRPTTNTLVGDLDFGPEAAIDYYALQERWFDYHLKGIDNGIMDEPPVSVFVMGENRWRDEDEFPPNRAVYTDYFLRAGPSGSIKSLNDGLLLLQKSESLEKPHSYLYDPLKPTPTIGGDHFIQPAGARDHRPAELLSLTYTTPVLEEDTEITGMPKLEFYAASSAVDTDWVVTISDVHPNGYSQHLRQNLLRARFRDGWERPELMEPGEIYKFVIDMFPISNNFQKGHRIRVTLASSSFPKWYPNGNTGTEMDEETKGIVATNTIYLDSNRPSRIVLPVIPSKPTR